MGNIREIYKVKIEDKKEDKKTKKVTNDIAAQPFGAEEMLLNAELKELENDDLTK